MESQKPKIAMYVKRPFGEKLNASFDFIKENWKQLFKYSTYLILPICLIQAANFSGLMGSMTDLTAMQASGGISDNPLAALGPSFALNYAGVIFFSCLGAINAKGTINANKSGMVRMSVKGVNTANKTTITTAKMNKKLQAIPIKNSLLILRSNNDLISPNTIPFRRSSRSLYNRTIA